MQNEYMFMAKTQAGALLKPLIETYLGLTNSIIFFINRLGINTYILNPTKQILIKSNFPADRFDKYVCNKTDIKVTMIADELYTHIKSIKKKNILSLFIESANRSQFGIAIDIHGEQMNSNISRIKILEVFDIVNITTDFEYRHMYKINAKEFQRAIKEIAKLGEIATIFGYKSHMGLKIEKDGVNIKEYRFNIVDNRDSNSREERQDAYVRQVETGLLNDVAKELLLHKVVTVGLTEGYPIHIGIDTGSIVRSDIYIKTTDMVAVD